MANPTEITISKAEYLPGEQVVVTLISPDPSVYHTFSQAWGNGLGNGSGSSENPVPQGASAPTRSISDGETLTFETSWPFAYDREFGLTLYTWSGPPYDDYEGSNLIGSRRVEARVKVPNPTKIVANKTVLNKGEDLIITLVDPDPSVYHTLDYRESSPSGDSGSTGGPIASPPTTSQSDPPTRPIPPGYQIVNDTGDTAINTIMWYTYTVKTWKYLDGGVGNWDVLGLVGESTVTATVYPAGTAPSLSDLGLSEGTPAVASANIGSYVQGVSTLNWDLAALATNGTKIVTGSLEINGVTYPSVKGKTAVLNTSGIVTVKGSATNNLGQTVSHTETIEVLPYEAPKITSLSAVRGNIQGFEDDNGEYMLLAFAGSVTPLTSGSQKNRLTYRVRSRPRGTDDWTTRYWVDDSTTLSRDTEGTVGVYPQGTAYEVRFDLSDIFGATAAITYMSKGGVLMDWGEGTMGIGKMHENGTLDVFGEIYQDGRRVLDSRDFATEAEVRAGAVDSKAITPTSLAYFTVDTGWVDVSSYLLSGFNGTVRVRAHGPVVELHGQITGSIPEGGATVDILRAIPEQFRPELRTRFGSAWRSGYTGNVVVRTSGTAGIAQRTVSWSGAEFAVTYFAD